MAHVVTHDGPVATITWSWGKLNTYTNAHLADLAAELRRLDADESVRAIILTGEGRDFCAGHDLAAAQAEGITREPPMLHYGDLSITTPVVAAIRGYTLGGGASIALACDCVVTADDTTFGYPQAKIGLISIAGPVRLPRLLPGLARYYVLSGQTMSAKHLVIYGLAFGPAPREGLLQWARKYALDLAGASPASVAAIRKTLVTADGLSLTGALNASKRNAAVFEQSAEYKAALAAFLAKRMQA